MQERYVRTVRSGETLTSIARETGIPVQSLFAMNRGVSQQVYDAATGRTITRTLTDPDLIWPGYVLKLGEEPVPEVKPDPVKPAEKSFGPLGVLAAAAAIFFMS